MESSHLQSLSPPRQQSVMIDVPMHSGFLYRPASWRIGSRERAPKHERDSLRSRSKEGRPGSRKHRRWTRSVELVSSLRRVMSAQGEQNLPQDEDAVEEARQEYRPSAFYRLLEHEGANALDAWAEAERKRELSPRARPKMNTAKNAAWLAEERRRHVRRSFQDVWQYVSHDESCRDLIAKLEDQTQNAFGVCERTEPAEETLQWLLSWDGNQLVSQSGAPPAEEILLLGLDPVQRKVVHQLARLIGLQSESRICESEFALASQRKALALRPPRSLKCRAGVVWAAPFSVSEVLANVVES
eukprot:TRINITY_DN14294_c0_g1_i1.p1 TRINITY_DN14294_c0_g1~~TRINITY_DN14294_c0_g1_i1.p1  ORF type:complete len:300 (-),score=57.58 TRINITY_DN14294_c0_g1_i1:185-1084(-)